MSKSKKIFQDDWTVLVEEARNRELSLDEKYALFNKLEAPINFAVTKVIQKFHAIPIERDDFQAICWIAFENTLERYWNRPTHKGFISYLIDSVYWKCMDYACKFTNNKHKILKFNYPKRSWKEYQTLDNELNMESFVLWWSLEDFFIKNRIEGEIQQIFKDYLNNLPHYQICEKYQISRNRLKLIVKQTIRDFSHFID